MTSTPVVSRPPTQTTGAGLRHDIEGLRAVAVLMVLAYHLRVPGVDGGFAGVDVFFVISGFLITGLLVREVRRHGRIDLLSFYARRARRLLPAALLVIAATFLTGWWVLPGNEQPRLAQDSLGATFYVVNWVFAARSVDYLAQDAAPSALLHYWTLSVEEQFYLLWPLVILLGVLVARRRAGRPLPVIAALLLLLTAASFAWSVLATESRTALAYFMTTTRLWELAVGALLVFLVPQLDNLPRLAREVLALGGLGAIAATLVLFSTSTPWPGYAALVPVLGAASVIAAGTSSRTFAGGLLSVRPAVWLGGLSYAVYLWHWPIIVLAAAQFGELGAAVRVGLGVLSVLLALATKHLVEDPVRFSRVLGVRPGASLGLAVAAMALTSVAVLAVLAQRPSTDEALASGAPTVSTAPTTSAPDATRPGAGHTEAPVTVSSGPGTLVADLEATPWVLRDDPAEAYTLSGPIAPAADRAPEDVPKYYADGCQIASGVVTPRDDCLYGDPDGTSEVVMLGDSKAGQWFSAVNAVAHEEGWRLALYLKSACPFTTAGAEDPDCNEFGQAVVEDLTTPSQAPALAFLSSGAASNPELLSGMTSAVSALQDAGTTVVVLRDNPYPPGSRYPCAEENPDHLDLCSFPARPPMGDPLLLAVSEDLRLDVVDLNPWICPKDTSCPVAIGERLIWRQGSHLTDTYVRNLTPFVYRALSNLGLTARAAEDIGIDDVPDRITSDG